MEDRSKRLMAITARADAHRGTAETALEARAQGEAFLATCRAAWPHPILDDWGDALLAAQRAPAYAVAVAVAGAPGGVPPSPAPPPPLHTLAAQLLSPRGRPRPPP